MRIRVYIDEDMPSSFSQALVNRGVDVVTTQLAGNAGLSDAEQLLYAERQARTMVTHNKRDFILLHNQYLCEKKEHAGIIVTDQLPVGVLLRRFMKLWFSKNAEGMKTRLEFLSNWA